MGGAPALPHEKCEVRALVKPPQRMKSSTDVEPLFGRPTTKMGKMVYGTSERPGTVSML